MKRTICLLMALAMLASVLSGCGGKQEEAVQAAPKAEKVMETADEEVTAVPATEPTWNLEEMLYNSLSERMKQAVDVGIVELSQLEDLNRIVTVGEASAMLQKAYVHRTGVESKMLKEFISDPVYAEETATLIWIAGVPGLADMELSHGDVYENYGQWRTYLNEETQGMEDLWWSFNWRLSMMAVVPGIAKEKTAYLYDENGDTYTTQFGVYWNGLFRELQWPDTPLYAYESEDPNPLDYGRAVYDSTNGRKYYSMTENMDWLGGMTVADVAECALVYYNFPNPMVYPTFVAPEDVGGFDPDIITADLLTKETDLPTPSCENLPKQWHGTVMDDMTIFERNHHQDDRVYEYEIQKVKEAGFNFIGLNLDFSWLQDNVLMDEQKDAYVGFVAEADVGKLSLERLKQLDRVVALCMEHDIHLNLRATDMGGYHNANRDSERNAINTVKNAPKLATMWQAIARRYAQIPNEYLSFTLFTSATDMDTTAAFLLPSVESIREITPERCIIADIYGWNMREGDVVTLAEQGVALSSRISTEPQGVFNFGAYKVDYFKYDGVRAALTAKGRNAIEGFDWPYKGTVDAKALLTMKQWRVPALDVMTVAQEYGVGYMLSDFGVTISPYSALEDACVFPRFRYPDEPYFTMIEDITSTMEELGYGWCFAHWYGPYGVAFCIPAIQTSTYEQVEDYPYYIDQGMFGLFREINGVS